MKRELTIDYIKAHDITDPTPWEEYIEEEDDEPYQVITDRLCPVCGKPFMSDEFIVCATLEGDYIRRYMFFVHADCLEDDAHDLLEKVGYDLIEDTGKFLDDEVKS